MLSERSMNKIGKHLENEGWTDEEIAEAIESIDTSKRVINIAMPLHFKEEAIHHAYCHCKYVLGLDQNSKKYKQAFQEAYMTYLTEAYENSRGVEGPGGGSHKKANPAGIEVHVFDQVTDKKITSDQQKMEIAEKAPAGLIFMGKDGWLQKSFKEMAKKISKENQNSDEIIKEIANQYSAAVVSLSNSFLYAFGGYKTKRKFGGVRIYKQDQNNEKSLEFSKKTGSTNDKEKMLDVAYRQMARQLYIICMSSIVAGTTALDNEVLADMEEGIKREIKKQWNQSGKTSAKKGQEPSDTPDLKFVLNRKIREQVIQNFFNFYNPIINEYRDIEEYGRKRRSQEVEAAEKCADEGKPGKLFSPRRFLLEEIRNCIKDWAGNPNKSQQVVQGALARAAGRKKKK